MESELILAFEPLIKKIASNFYGAEFDDLLQAGRIGLFNAYEHFIDDGNTKFSTFAYKYIFGEMYKISALNKTIKQSKDNLKILKLVEQSKFLLTQSLGKEPSISDIAIYLNIDEEIISQAIIASSEILSLDQEKDMDTNLYNKIGDNIDNDLNIDIKNSLNTLENLEKEIIKCRYFNDLTQSETAERLGMSQVSVSRYEKRSLSKMQKYFVCE